MLKADQPTAQGILTEMLTNYGLDDDEAKRCATSIGEALAEREYYLTYKGKAHHMSHAICPCGCGTVAIVMHDEHDHAFASGQLDPMNMMVFCQEITNTCMGLIKPDFPNSPT